LLLSVVVPCHNEESNVAALRDAVFSSMEGLDDTTFELVFVDDGSVDDTLFELRRLAAQDSRVHFISFSRNFGKESAMLAGLGAARGDAVVIMDADLQHPANLIPQLVERFRAGYDQVVARRTRSGDARHRTWGAGVYYRLVNSLMEVKLDDGSGDFRLLSRRAADAVLALPEFNRFSKGLFSWIGFPTAVVDYENVLRTRGSSTWTFRRLLDYGVDGVLSFNNKPLRLAIYLGSAVAVLSLLYIAYLIGAVAVNGIEVPGYVTLISAICLLGGLQLLFIGVVGEYVGRIYFETKRRPHYLVKESSIAADVAPAGVPLSLEREGGSD
jgi:glycosyltransferase involved in cell wall biosynthesis